MSRPSGAGIAAAIGAAVAWGVALGLVETSYVTVANRILPLGAGHAALAFLLAAVHAATAIAAVAAAAVVTRMSPGGAVLRLTAGPALLIAMLALSLYRDHFRGSLPGTRGMVAGAALAAAVAAVWLLLGLRAAPGRAARIRSALLAVAGVFAVGSIVVLAVSHPPAPPPAPPSVTAEEVGPAPDTGLRVLVVGLDGGAWKAIDPLREAGRMPALDALCRQGVTARLRTDLPTFSPNLWTSIATGKTLEKHGIRSHVYTELPFGLPAVDLKWDRIRFLTKTLKYLIRAAQRRGDLPLGVYGAENLHARRYWDVAGDFGMRSVTLEWYVTHPARPVDGVEVSDRFHLLEGGALARAVYPDTLAPRLAGDIVKPDATRPRMAELVDTTGLDAAGTAEILDRFPEVFRTLESELARDLTTRNLVRSVFPLVPDWRVASVYYRAMDASHHMTWQYRDPGPKDPDDPAQRLREVVDRYHEICDDLLRATLEVANDTTVVVVLSDHGWEDAVHAHSRKPDGFLVMAGGPVRKGMERAEMSVYDVAPTILALLGIPVPEDMDGRPQMQLVEPDFWERFPVRTVTSYERPGEESAATGSTVADDEEFLEQLRALGYVDQ